MYKKLRERDDFKKIKTQVWNEAQGKFIDYEKRIPIKIIDYIDEETGNRKIEEIGVNYNSTIYLDKDGLLSDVKIERK